MTCRRKRIIKSVEAEEPTFSVAVDYLRMALRVLLQHEAYLDPTRIDEDLILRGLLSKEGA